jgi:photosystem II stability/assembly factor-like uncharacterized protein
MKSVVVVAGTKKGVFVLQSNTDRKDWSLRGPFVGGIDINHAIIDPRNGRLYATANNPWFGPQVSYSDDLGETWQDCPSSPRFKEDPVADEEHPWFFAEAKVTDRFWRIEPGRASEPGTVFCGVAPGTLFKSTDSGKTWNEDNALSGHPTRAGWQPSNGGLAMHSIVLDHENKDRMWIAVSAGGVYRTDDGGESWKPTNTGIRDIGATFDPNLPLYPESGQCVHQLVRSPGDRLYLQTHLGTYRSDDGGDNWVDITEGLPSEFGLAMTNHPHDRDTAYVAPIIGGELRVPPDFSLRVYRTRDAGRSWEPHGNGLPSTQAFMTVYRNGLGRDDLDPAGIYVGTNTGQLYCSTDEGDTWAQMTPNLPPISSVQAIVMD